MGNTQGKGKKPRLVDIDKVGVLGLSELAKRWKVSKQRAAEIAEDRCPHWRRIACGRIWLMEDVVNFERTWERKTGVHLDRAEPGATSE